MVPEYQLLRIELVHVGVFLVGLLLDMNLLVFFVEYVFSPFLSFFHDVLFLNVIFLLLALHRLFVYAVFLSLLLLLLFQLLFESSDVLVLNLAKRRIYFWILP